MASTKKDNLANKMQKLAIGDEGHAPNPPTGRNNGNRGSRESRVNDSKEGDKNAPSKERKDRNHFEIVKTRPEKYQNNKRGMDGTVVKLKANYFAMTPLKAQWAIYQYRVDFLPDVELTFIKKALLKPFRKEFNGYVFDGTMLFTCTKLLEETKTWTTSRTNGDKVQIQLKYVGNIPPETALQVLNVILRTAMDGLKLQLIRRNYFDFDPLVIQKIPGHQLNIYPGYITSIRQHERSILMCAELTSKIMRTESVLAVFANMVRNRRGNENVRLTFEKEVIGMIVMTSYNNKTYRVDDVDWNIDPTFTFEKKDKTSMTYKDYYKHKFNIQITDLRQPLLLSKPTEKQQRGGDTEMVYLIPELCIPTGLSDSMRKDFNLMRAVANHTRVGPQQRIARLLKMNERIRNASGSKLVLDDWDVKLQGNLVEFEGREMEPETIICGAGEKIRGTEKADWTMSLLHKKLFATSVLKNWVVVTPKMLERETQNFLRILRTSVASIGWSFAQPRIVTMPDERPFTVTQSLREARNSDPELMMVIVSGQNLYSSIKKFCCVQEPILSQVVTKRSIIMPEHKLKSVCTKIGIQMNCKLGAVPWMLALPIKGMMTVGFDVCHDKAFKDKSFGALVASMDMNTSMKYFSVASPHKDGTELSKDIATHFQRALYAYKEEHGTLPAHIVFYRDGVGEGQLRHVYDVEVKQLNSILKEMDEKIQFTFVVVCKRINTRIFKGFENPKPGTVVDDVITLPERYDFFLVSQMVTQGTATPTSYNIIYDNSRILTPGRLQTLTFKLCHLYYNWSGTVRVPAVCQYAHKLSLLMGQHVHAVPSEHLSKKLYFL